MELRLPDPCLAVLVGPSGAGKSAWAAEQFKSEQIVSTDRLRALVGEGEHDQRAGTDAFAVLDLVLERRLKRRLTTVIDSLGLDAERRARWRAAAEKAGVPCHAVVFDTDAKECRARNKARGSPVPSKVLTAQLRAHAEQREHLDDEGFAAVHAPGSVRLIAAELYDAPAHAARQKERPMTMTFGLQIPASPGRAVPPSCGPSWPPPPRRPRRPVSRACGSWTTSCRSPWSAASGRTCSTATRRSGTWPASPTGCVSAPW